MDFPELNINYLADGDLVIYEDSDVEFKHKSNSFNSSRLVTEHRLPYGTILPDMKYVVNKGTEKELKCAVVKTDDEKYEFYNSIPNCTPYGYSNKPNQ